MYGTSTLSQRQLDIVRTLVPSIPISSRTTIWRNQKQYLSEVYDSIFSLKTLGEKSMIGIEGVLSKYGFKGNVDIPLDDTINALG